MIKFLLWIWQLPQNLVGFFMTLNRVAVLKHKVYISEDKKNKEIKVYYTNNVAGCGVSLGDYIILDYKHYYPSLDPNNITEWMKTTIKHEYGHSIQSKMLGPLYLLVVGLPSAIFNNLWQRLFMRHLTPSESIKWYYNRYPEKWADRLGGVIRR